MRLRPSVQPLRRNIYNDYFVTLLTCGFCFDGDNAGQHAAISALETALPIIRDGHSIFIHLPDNEDPDSL